jgi:hypothetical protein
MQRAALDKYIQLRVREQIRQKEDVESLINTYLQNHDPAVITKCHERLFADVETEEMKALKAEADTLGKESDALFGVRNEGFFNLDQDHVGLGWVQRQFTASLISSDSTFTERLLGQIVHYEDPGPGGFYDDAGDPLRSPHMAYGWQFSDDDVSPSNRPSQRTMAYTRDEKRGVTFEYTDLDANAKYRVRFAFVRPRYEARYADKQPQKTQSIYADDVLLAKDVELPEWEAGFFEYDIPEEATRDGKLQIRLEKSAGIGEGSPSQVEVWRNTGGWGTLVSEVWLMPRP